MADDALETKVEQLAAQVQALTATVEKLSARMDPAQAKAPPSLAAGAPSPWEEPASDEAGEVTEELLSWAGRAALLPRLSTLCFLLVAALILRTITDNGIINTLLGSALGMGYATILMLAGWRSYSKESPLAPVFAACGAILMAVIVVETHTRFQSLPLVPAYLTLMATAIAMAVISYRFSVFVPISAGTLGMCLAGAAIDYPNPFFPYLAMILWTANVLGFFAARLQRCSWLRWIVLAVSVMMLFLWAVKLGLPLARHEQAPAALALPWFLPVLALFLLTYLALALAGIIRSGAERVARFDYLLPTINVIWAYSAAYYVISVSEGSRALLGWTGLCSAIIHLWLGVWLAGRKAAEGSGANACIFAGATLLALALPAATGGLLLSLPVLAVAAVFLAIMSRVWDNGGVRITTYILQLYACGALTLILRNSSTAADFLTVIPAGLLAIISLFHYQWCRKSPPPAHSAFFARFDKLDRSAALLLLAALLSGFFALRSCIYQFLLILPGDIANSFRCAQTVLINSAAMGLMSFAFVLRNREIRNAAILVTMIGAIKVFLYDMLGAHGVPLVASVFSFGLAAALESIALGRWQKGIAPPESAVASEQTHSAERG